MAISRDAVKDRAGSALTDNKSIAARIDTPPPANACGMAPLGEYRVTDGLMGAEHIAAKALIEGIGPAPKMPDLKCDWDKHARFEDPSLTETPEYANNAPSLGATR